MSGVLFLRAANTAECLGPQNLVLAHSLGPCQRSLIVIPSTTTAASCRIGRRNDIEPSCQTQTPALLRLHRLRQRSTPHDALVSVVCLGRVDGHVDLIHARLGFHAQLGNARHANLGWVLCNLVDILEDNEVAVLRERGLDED